MNNIYLCIYLIHTTCIDICSHFISNNSNDNNSQTLSIEFFHYEFNAI